MNVDGHERERLLVIFLTDVEGSTRHWQHDSERMTAALDVLDSAVETAVSGDGRIVRTRGEGDSHFVVFGGAAAAVHAAAVLQRRLREAAWPGGVELRVRVALHAGDIRTRYHDYSGIAINHTARLRSAAHGGQVVASRAIVELANTGIVDELRFKNLGRHRLRDMPGWTEIFQLCGPSLERSFPPLVTLDAGLPPITAIVALDAVGTSRAVADASVDQEQALFRRLVEVFAESFSACDGQYLKQVGDGCLALFADPDVALAFARTARSEAHRHGLCLRSALHLGRVEFVHEEPIGHSIFVAAALVRETPPDRIGLSPAAAALIDDADDLVAIDTVGAAP
jgi:class 3 adenylate cyclase